MHQTQNGLSKNAKAFTIQIKWPQPVAFIEFSGHVVFKDVVDSFSELIREPLFQFNMPACYDLSNALVDVDLTETEIFLQFANEMRAKRGDQYKLAFVYHDEMTKMLVDFYRVLLARTEIDVLATKSRSEAETWLKQPFHESSLSSIYQPD